MRRFLCSLAVGCGADDVGLASSGEETGSTTSTSTSTSTSTATSTFTSTSTSTSTTTTTSDESSSSGVPAECGNGIVEDPEECDDAESCRSDCLLPCRAITVTHVDDDADGLLALDDVQPGPDGTAIAVGTLGWQWGEVVTATVDAEGELLALDLSGSDERGIAISVADDGSRFVLADSVTVAHVRHYDPDGELLWDDTPLDASEVTGMAAMPGGGVVVSGTAQLGEFGHYEVWAARYGSSGHVWSASWADVGPEVQWRPHGGPVAASSLGRIFVAGDQPSVSGLFGVYDPIVAAFGPEGGAPLWSWSEWLESSNLALLARDIVVDAQGRVAALFLVAHGSVASSHFQLRVFEPDGRPVRAFDSADLDIDGGEQAGALVADADGRLIVFALRTSSQAGEDSGLTHVLGFDDAGEIVCSETIEDDLGWVSAAALDDAGDILVSGNRFTTSTDSYGVVARVRGF
jgi:hypothetical protein